jgi:hypothetical protein
VTANSATKVLIFSAAIACECAPNRESAAGSGGSATSPGGAPGAGGIPGSGGTSGWVGSGGVAACVGDTSALGSLRLQATPAVIAPGQSTTLSWYDYPNTTGVTLTMDRGIGSVRGKTSQTVSPAKTTTYTLTQSLTDVFTVEDKVTVVVTEKAFVPTGSMSEARSGHTATLLPSGKVLIVGGSDRAELYDPGTGTFSTIGAALTSARPINTATLLANGKVLIVHGGMDFSSAELYDSTTNTFVATGSPGIARESCTATLLANGKVLVAGGTTAEVYDPATGEFSATGNLTVERSKHVATLLPDGRVLFAGGYVPPTSTGNNDGLDSAELYDPTAGSFAATGSCGRRVAPVANVLADGTVLVGGGWSGFEGYFNSNSLAIYDPTVGRATGAATMVVSRALFSMTSLADGTVLMVGGLQHVNGSEETYLSNAEIYDPNGRSSTLTACMREARCAHTSTLLADGRVLIAGGMRAGRALASAEVYQ